MAHWPVRFTGLASADALCVLDVHQLTLLFLGLRPAAILAVGSLEW